MTATSDAKPRQIRWLGMKFQADRRGDCSTLTCDKNSAGRQRFEYVDEDGMRRSRRGGGYHWPCRDCVKPRGLIEDQDSL